MSSSVDSTVRRPDPYAHLAPLLMRLPQLDHDDDERRQLRDTLAVAFLPVVVNIASRYRGRGEPDDDLRQAGSIGLLGALDRFVPAVDAVDPVGAFLGFAVPTVTGEIRRHFRDRTWAMRVPRTVKDLQGPVRDAVVALSRELRRAPRPSEIAARLGVPVSDVVDALQAHGAHTPASIDTPSLPDGGTIAERLGTTDVELQHAEYRHELRVALDALPARERHILVLRFFGDMTQTQIGAETGLSQMHVSRLLSRSLATLRARMGPAQV